MSVTIYTNNGLPDIRSLVMSIVKDLAYTDGPAPVQGTKAEHMKVIYPEGFDLTQSGGDLDPDKALIILESTTNIDPFARTDTTVNDPNTDPWRIAFHYNKWASRATATAGATETAGWTVTEDKKTNILSLAVYVGTPGTLGLDADGNPQIGWATTSKQKLPYFKGYPDNLYDGYLIGAAELAESGGAAPDERWKYSKNYRGRDLVEPVGNTGAQWTNTFDPTLHTTKMRSVPSTTGLPGIPPAPSASTSGTNYKLVNIWDGPDVNDPAQLFINRYVTAAASLSADTGFGGFAANSETAQSMSYRLVLTDHGLFLGCWGPDPEENGSGFSWLLVQRPVNKKTGIVRDLPIDPANPGNRPLFCVNSVGGQYFRFVVREHDNAVPGTRKDATKNSRDSGQVINPYQQQSLTENGEYVITFLNNLNSSRFKYSDELDMVGTVSSDVVGGGSNIDVNVYGEKDESDAPSARTYHALWSSGSFGTKMRIMVVADIPNPNTPA